MAVDYAALADQARNPKTVDYGALAEQARGKKEKEHKEEPTSAQDVALSFGGGLASGAVQSLKGLAELPVTAYQAASRAYQLGPYGLMAEAQRETPAIAKQLPKEAKQKYQEFVEATPKEKGRMAGELTGGIVAPGALAKVLRPLTNPIGSWISRISASPEKKAASIAAEAFGDNLPKAREILRQASGDLTTSQALASIDPRTGQAVLNAPTAQALLQRAQDRDPEFFTSLFGKQEARRLTELQRIAGGTDQTAAKIAQEEMRKTLNDRLIPVLQGELNSANIGNQMLPVLRTMEATSAENATRSVEDVRRMVAAGGRAAERAKTTVTVPGQPRVPGRYTYAGELAEKADQVASDAAKGSLRFGQARDLAKAARQELEDNGLKELTGDSIFRSIRKKLSDPTLAGNKDIEIVLNNVAKDIKKWTNADGVIDARALDAIRKNSVNSAVQKLYRGDPALQRRVAAQVTENIRPVIIDAIEDAGGTGYRKYLTDYAVAAQKIDQKKLGATLLDLYQRSPKEFVRWVEGNAPEKVEDIFGPGSYNIFKELSPETQSRLQRVAGELTREDLIKEQAKAGTRRLEEVLKTNLGGFQLPHILSRKVTMVNTALDELEGKVSKKTMDALTKAARSANDMNDLLNKLPPGERFEASKVLRKAGLLGAGAVGYETGED